jgi:hypothetical protein
MIAVIEQPNSLPEIAFGDCLAKRPNGAEADGNMTQTLAACLSAGIEIVSLLPEWVELRVPCDLAAISPLQELVKQLEVGLSPEVGEAITFAFREMLCNAIEYGGHLDPTSLVEVRLMRLKRAFICRIKDPGDGFDPLTWTTQQSVTRMTILFAMPLCVRRRVCAGEASAFCSPASTSTTWSTTTGITKWSSLSIYLEL